MGEHVYSLSAVVHHDGPDVCFGHYTCAALSRGSSNGYLCDDIVVEETKDFQSDVLKPKQAYMWFYTLKGSFYKADAEHIHTL